MASLMALGTPAAVVERPLVMRGRVALYFTIRYLTPLLALVAIAASDLRPDPRRLGAVLTAQVALALATHLVAARNPSALGLALTTGMIADAAVLASIVAVTGGAGGPLAFLFTLHALAAGVLLSARAGVQMLAVSTLALLTVDITTHSPASEGLPRGLAAVAALWILGGAGTLFASFNERELRRRNAELATIRHVTLDIEDSLTITEILADLCRGVVGGFGFDGAAVLVREGPAVRCAGAHGITGALDVTLELRGRLEASFRADRPQVTPGTVAAKDGSLLPLIGPRGYVGIPVGEDTLLVVTRSARKRRAPLVRANEIDALERLAHHAKLAIGNARLHERVAEMAVTDPLTGLANHGELQRRLAQEAGRIQRYASLRASGHRMSLLLVDIDRFKALNDAHGHQAGDAVLKGLGTVLRAAVRSFDVVARYGGEEFAVILPETGAGQAREVAERIRAAVGQYPFAIHESGKPLRVTVSIGGATAPENGATPASVIRAADAALYRSKANGRDRVSHALDQSAPGAAVLPLRRRRQERDGGPARGGSQRAPGRSSLPRRRTPPA